MAFNLSEEDLDKREDMFNKVDINIYSTVIEYVILYLKLKKIGNFSLKLCQQKQKAGLEDCGSGLEWGDEGELTFQTVVDKRDWHSKQQHQDSSSSDDSNSSEDSSSSEEEPRNMNMEVETTDRMFL